MKLRAKQLVNISRFQQTRGRDSQCNWYNKQEKKVPRQWLDFALIEESSALEDLVQLEFQVFNGFVARIKVAVIGRC